MWRATTTSGDVIQENSHKSEILLYTIDIYHSHRLSDIDHILWIKMEEGSLL